VSEHVSASGAPVGRCMTRAVVADLGDGLKQRPMGRSMVRDQGGPPSRARHCIIISDQEPSDTMNGEHGKAERTSEDIAIECVDMQCIYLVAQASVRPEKRSTYRAWRGVTGILVPLSRRLRHFSGSHQPIGPRTMACRSISVGLELLRLHWIDGC